MALADPPAGLILKESDDIALPAELSLTILKNLSPSPRSAFAVNDVALVIAIVVPKVDLAVPPP
jgi:hypothetical protein